MIRKNSHDQVEDYLQSYVESNWTKLITGMSVKVEQMTKVKMEDFRWKYKQRYNLCLLTCYSFCLYKSVKLN